MIVDAFIAQNPLPEAWGANDSWRFAVAVFVVEMAHMPELVNVKPDFGRDGSGEELRRQIEFCTRFAQAPDYFCRLVQFARDQYQRQSQLDIATEFLRNGRFEKKYKLENGRDPTDCEIALEIMQLWKLDDFKDHWVGRARREMTSQDEQIRNNVIGRYPGWSNDGR